MVRDPNNAELLLTLCKLRVTCSGIKRAEVSPIRSLLNRRAHFGGDSRRTCSSTLSWIERFVIIILMDFNDHLLFKKITFFFFYVQNICIYYSLDQF